MRVKDFRLGRADILLRLIPQKLYLLFRMLHGIDYPFLLSGSIRNTVFYDR